MGTLSRLFVVGCGILATIYAGWLIVGLAYAQWGVWAGLILFPAMTSLIYFVTYGRSIINDLTKKQGDTE